MKINTTQTIKNYKGKDIPVRPGSKEKITLRDIISTAINATPAPPVKPMTAEVKNKAYQISIKIWSKKEVNLTVDDMAFIKGKVFEVYAPLVAGRVSDIFEGKDEKESKKSDTKA